MRNLNHIFITLIHHTRSKYSNSVLTGAKSKYFSRVIGSGNKITNTNNTDTNTNTCVFGVASKSGIRAGRVIRSAGQIGQNLADENRKLEENLPLAFGYKSALVMTGYKP